MDEPDFSLKDAHICIVGLGLMGGSLAIALRRALWITGIDLDPDSCEHALQSEIADAVGSDLSLAARADVVILATPMQTIINQIGELGAIMKPDALLMDLGSVKTPVVQAMNALPSHIRAIAGHPMCGREVSGLRYATGDLFQGARFILCPTERTTPEARSLAIWLVQQIGAVPTEMLAERHDQAVAAISALPYLLSAALTQVAGEHAETDAFIWKLAASGFRDTSRLAGSDPVMMRDILLTNADAVLQEVEQAKIQLDELAALIRSENVQGLLHWLSRAQVHRHHWEESQKKK